MAFDDAQQWIYRFALKMIPGMGDVTLRKLLEYYGSAERIFLTPRAELLKLRGLSCTVAEGIVNKLYLPQAEAEWKFIERNRISALYFQDGAYPLRLTHCQDSPVFLFFRGKMDLNSRRTIGIVGTRKATENGKYITEKIIHGLADYGVSIISGLAYGIDTQAHRVAVNAQIPTLAVLGHGLDTLYPYQNRGLAQKMIANGGLISEFFSQTLPDRENFPRRNRIIAGLCDGIVVVEAAHKGGALITAEIATSYNRDVFAVPGRWNDEYSAGCNALIKTNKAALIQSAEDILYIMGWDTKPSGFQVQARLFGEMPEKEQKIYSILLKDGVAGIDWLCHITGFKGSEMAALLLKMEFDGVVRVLPGKLFALS